ncbi:MAG: ATP-dependent DNA helicase RecG [Bacilli bacterium]|jgi:ATP-dependent DNA helicase RecG
MDDLSLIKGLGPKTKQYLNKLNIYNINDLITHYPFRYENLKQSNLDSLNQNDKVISEGTILTKPLISRYGKNQNRLTFSLETKEIIIKVIIFNRAFLINQLIIGRSITIIGKYDKYNNTIIASDILWESLPKEGRIEPIYSLTKGLNKKNLKKFIQSALIIKKDNIFDYLPNFIKEKYNFIDKTSSLIYVHNPPNMEKLKRSLLRLKYEELFLFLLKVNYLKEYNLIQDENYIKVFSQVEVKDFINKLPFKLTKDQLKVVDEIIKDLTSSRKMNRLIQGDVGSGKTIVSFIAIYIIYLAGYQSALMVPTEILAKQHYKTAQSIFQNTNLKCQLLIGSLTKKEKEEIYFQLESGTIDLIIGTHALITESINYHNLGLVITDEQHRFGVNQRSTLKNKGLSPEVLYMSATPIPRTYALTIYGDMDVSTIKEKPFGQQKVKTYLKRNNEITSVLTMIKKELDQNHQVYVVAPLIDDEDNSMENIIKLKRRFSLAFGKIAKINILHGKMDSKEKEQIMNLFSQNLINILISTTVIEVGIDVSNATMMIIFNAERFGLSTLHQLRGRVGRSNLLSFCIMISDSETKRLKILTETDDGFQISEEDFKLRGQGDLFGVRQSGDFNFKIANIKKDIKILLKAKEDVDALLKDGYLDQDLRLQEVLKKEIS